MASIEVGMLRPGSQFLAPFQRNLGDAWLVIIKRLAPHNTIKWLEENFGYDRSTAKNAVKGVVGAVPITRAMHERQKRHGDAWMLWRALGELIIGEPEAAYDARVLQQMAEELERARQATEARLAAEGRMDASAAELLSLADGLNVKPRHDRVGGAGTGDHGVVAGSHQASHGNSARPVEVRTFAPRDRGRP